MTPEQTSRLRAYYRSLRGQLRVLEGSSEKQYQLLKEPSLSVLEAELASIDREFPGLIPYFHKLEYFSHGTMHDRMYHATPILGVIERALSRIEPIIDESKNTPVTETREFRFVTERQLREILERDYAEIQRAYVSECWKSVIILSGSAIEAILLDRVQTEASKARAWSKAPKENDLTRWDLAQLIDVTVGLWPELAGVEKLSHSVRGYRNLVHPGNEIRTGLTFEREEARIALEVLNLVHRELS
jgi:hypothetical protein